jgi:beta-glucosidase
LKNENGVLPLKSTDKVCFVGDFANAPRYQGAGSSVVNPTQVEKSTDFGAMDGAYEYVGYAQGFDRYGKKKPKLVKEALALVANCDKVVFFAGLDEVTEAEGLDRRDIKIPQNQLDLLKEIYALGKQVIVVLSCGSAVELETVIDADAIVHSYLSGQASATATLNVLIGKVNPSGKLSETLPVKYEDCSSATHFPGKAMTVEYREGIFVGYRYYQTAEVPVQFPFGFGLSYTKFEYSNLTCTDKGVKFTVKNVGDVDGKEVCQLYVGKKDSAIFRPVRELKGFAKVALKAGESKEVEIAFDEFTFRFFDVITNTWQVEGGEYAIEIGASSQDIRLASTVEKAGTVSEFAYNKEDLPSYYSGKAGDVSDAEWEKLLGRPIPDGNYKFYKKNRMVIHENCTIDDLRYSKRWVGRVFSWAIRAAKGLMGGLLGNRTMANTLEMGMVHQPIRGLAKFGGMTRRQMEGMIMMFNGHLFKGLGKMMSKDPEQKKAEQEAKKQKKQK